MEGVEETRNENTDGLAQPDNQAGYPQTALGTYNQTNTVPNGHGAEQVSIRGVQQVIENRPDVQNETHVGLADDRGHLSISNVPGGVQVAVVPSTDDVRVVDGSLASAASAVEGTDDGTHTVVTAMPAEYGLPGALQAQYVLHEEHEGKITFVFLGLLKLKFSLESIGWFSLQSLDAHGSHFRNPLENNGIVLSCPPICDFHTWNQSLATFPGN